MQFTEEEDKLINWLRQNYLNIILGLVIGFSFIAGYNYYNSSVMNTQPQMEICLHMPLKHSKWASL